MLMETIPCCSVSRKRRWHSLMPFFHPQKQMLTLRTLTETLQPLLPLKMAWRTVWTWFLLEDRVVRKSESTNNQWKRWIVFRNWPITGLESRIWNIFISGGLNINHRYKDGECLLTIAMMKHDYDIAKILVKMPRINLDVIDQNGISFPFILLKAENLELIEQIIKVFS